MPNSIIVIGKYDHPPNSLFSIMVWLCLIWHHPFNYIWKSR